MKKRKAIRGIQYVVKNCSWKRQVTIEKDFGNEQEKMLEACTRAVEWESKNNKNFEMSALTEICRLENRKNISEYYWVNSFIILINAGLYNHAEILRKGLKKELGVDALDLKNTGINGNNSKNKINSDVYLFNRNNNELPF